MAPNGFTNMLVQGFIRSGDDEMQSGFIFKSTQCSVKSSQTRNGLVAIHVGRRRMDTKYNQEETYSLTLRLLHGFAVTNDIPLFDA
jgi:hypothetical protein